MFSATCPKLTRKASSPSRSQNKNAIVSLLPCASTAPQLDFLLHKRLKSAVRWDGLSTVSTVASGVHLLALSSLDNTREPLTITTTTFLQNYIVQWSFSRHSSKEAPHGVRAQSQSFPTSTIPSSFGRTLVPPRKSWLRTFQLCARVPHLHQGYVTNPTASGSFLCTLSYTQTASTAMDSDPMKFFSVSPQTSIP